MARREKGECGIGEEDLLSGGVSGNVEKDLVDGLEDSEVARSMMAGMSCGALPLDCALETLHAAGLISTK